MTLVFAGLPSTTGEPRVRLELVLRLLPGEFAKLTEDGTTLDEIGTHIMRAVEIDGGTVEVLSLTQHLYRESAPPPDPNEPMKMFRELMDRIGPKREPWERGDGGGDPV